MIKADCINIFWNRIVVNRATLAIKVTIVLVHIISILTIALILTFFAAINVRADYADPEIKQQENKQTDLFEKSVGNMPALTRALEDQEKSCIDFITNDQGHAKGLSLLTKKSKEELANESKQLEGIHEHDLSSRGREELIKSNALNELYIDYSKPLNKQHMRDAKSIAAAQSKLGDNLFKELKDIGIDCGAIKGDQRVEPEYNLQIKTTEHKDTVYNQTMCEELRNTYSCRDTVVLRCAKRGKRYGDWQNREIDISGDTVYHGAKHLGYAIFWKKKRHGWHLHNNSAGWRDFLSRHLNIPIEQIDTTVNLPFGNRGFGGTHPVYENWRIVFDQYRFAYRYRDAYDICEAWSEDWTERCGIGAASRSVVKKAGERKK